MYGCGNARAVSHSQSDTNRSEAGQSLLTNTVIEAYLHFCSARGSVSSHVFKLVTFYKTHLHYPDTRILLKLQCECPILGSGLFSDFFHIHSRPLIPLFFRITIQAGIPVPSLFPQFSYLETEVRQSHSFIFFTLLIYNS